MEISLKNHQVKKFDRKYGVDTYGIIHPSELDIQYKNRIYGKSYEPVGVIDFEEIYHDLKIPYEEYIFIDLGSGKGLACLLASALPFKKIIGIEYSNELNNIAKNNIRIYPDEKQKCKNYEFICMDACDFHFPNEPFILFLYNPFDSPIMSCIADKISDLYREQPRRIIITYFIPVYDYIWDRITFLNKIFIKKRYTIWDSNPVTV